MVKIPLSQGKVALVDDEDAHFAEHRWYAHRGTTGGWYAKRTAPDGSKLLLHREVLGVTGKKIEVDHTNGDGLDCRRGNLRCATSTQNKHNRGKNRNNTSGFKGVSFDRHRQSRGLPPWQAKITIAYRTVFLGFYLTPETAAMAYDARARAEHGAFARPNFQEAQRGDQPNQDR